ncbi:hypothetical protein B566_EDAN001886 [Ephemera danica]|nr:hypothetical protein B566_EDAN001886 [Ephemera danica]
MTLSPEVIATTTPNNAHVRNLWPSANTAAQDSSSADESLPTSPPPPLLERLQQVPLTPPRPRGPKHPVPDELKDERYFKRRRRNNEAAKRSRRARKERQDADMQRITEAEGENALLRMQLLQLRAEYDTLAQLLMRRQALYFPHPAFVPPHDN